MIYIAYFLFVIVFGLGGFWLVARLAEAKGRVQEDLRNRRETQDDLHKRVTDAVRAHDSVDASAAKLREDDGYRRID